MKSNITFKTTTGNYYLYNRNIQTLLLTHPLIHYFIKLENNNIKIDDNILKNNIHINGIGEFNEKDIKYYYKKYLFLKNKNILNKLYFQKRCNYNNINKYLLKSLFANCDNIVFEVTEKCNLNCLYCGYGENYDWYEKRNNSDLSLNKAITFLDYYFKFSESHLSKSYKKDVTIGFYGGEPLLNFTFIKNIVEYVSKLSLKRTNVKFGMTTNGLLIKKYFNFIKMHDFKLLVSLDGNKKHNSYRVYKNDKTSFDDVMRNINYIKNNYPDFYLKNIKFNSVLTNKSNVSDIYNFFKNTLNKSTSIMEITTEGIKQSKKSEFLKIYKNYSESIMQSENYSNIEKQKLLELPTSVELTSFIRNSLFSYKTYKSLLYEKHNQKNHGMTASCIPFSFKIFITADGNILPCENVKHKYSLGYITEKKVFIDFEKESDKYLSYLNSIKKQCFNCYFQTDCQQCLYYLDMESNPKCAGYTDKIEDYETFLSSRVKLLERNPETYFE